MKQTLKYIDRVSSMLKDVNIDFFERHFISLNNAVATYGTLKCVYEKDMNKYEGFQDAFFKFYKINRFASKQFKNDFYNKLIELKGSKDLDIKKLVLELKDIENNQFQFSFVTKLLNIVDDTKYPIYDSNIRQVFGLYIAVKNTDKEKVDQYLEHYTIIEETYREILPKHQEIIFQFRNLFKYSENLSDMRILDLIIWEIGGTMKKN